MSPSAFLEQVRVWSESGEGEPVDRLDKSFVHKREARNVFVQRIAALPSADEYAAQLTIDSQHPYHFEHPQDHVPGMMLVEAGRQLAMAIAHLYYKVPLESVFVLNEVSISFSRFAELSAPIFVQSRVLEKVVRRDQLVAMSLGGEFIQHGEVLGAMSGRWTMFDAALVRRLRRRGRTETAEPPAVAPATPATSRVG